MRASALCRHNQALVSKHRYGAARGRAGYAAQIHDVFLARYPAPRRILTRLDLVPEPCCYLPVRRLWSFVVDLDLHVIMLPVADCVYPLSYGARYIARDRDGAVRSDIGYACPEQPPGPGSSKPRKLANAAFG
jgi:hypothetical protein